MDGARRRAGLLGRDRAAARQRRLDRGPADGDRAARCAAGAAVALASFPRCTGPTAVRSTSIASRRRCARRRRPAHRCHAKRRRDCRSTSVRSIPTSSSSRPTSGCSDPTAAPSSMSPGATRPAFRWSRRASAAAPSAPTRTSISRTSTTSPTRGASTWASAITSSPWRWPPSAWRWWPNGAAPRRRSARHADRAPRRWPARNAACFRRACAPRIS